MRNRTSLFTSALTLTAGLVATMPALTSLGQPAGTVPSAPTAPAKPAAPAPADAAPVAVKPPYFDGTLEQGLAAANAQSRLLLLVIAPTAQRQKEEDARWSSAPLAAWVKRHAVLVRVTDAAQVKLLGESMLKMAPGDDPFVFRASKSVRVFGSAWSPEGQRAIRLKGPARPSDTFAGLILRLDWTRRSIAAADAAWAAAHATAIGPVPAQLPTQAGDATSPTGAVAAWLKAADRAEPAALRSALAAICNDPAARTLLQPALLTTAAAAAQERAKADPAARAAYLSLARDLLAGTDWADAWSAWRTLALLRVVDRHVENLAFLNAALDDQDARPAMLKTGPEPDAPTKPAPAMLGTPDRVILDLALPRMHFRTDLVLNADVASRVAALLADAAKAPPGTADAKSWARVQNFRRELAAFEAARGYAALLGAARDADAAKVLAALAEPAAGDAKQAAGARLGCIVAALAAGQTRPGMQEVIATDAKALGVDPAPLLEAAKVAAPAKP